MSTTMQATKKLNGKHELDGMQELREAVHEGMETTTESGKRVAQAAAAAARGAASRAGRMVGEQADNARKMIADRPFTSVLVAAGVGAALYMLWSRKR